MQYRHSKLVAASLIFGLATCTDSSARKQRSEVADSSGIQIVMNRRPAWGPDDGWEVQATPLVQVGVREGDPAYQFGSVWEVKRLSDGRLITADEMARELRVFDSSGQHLLRIGGEGEGPGEFRAVRLVGGYRGDSIYAYDYFQMRTSIFSPDGRFARAIGNPVPGSYPVGGAFDDGRWLFTK